MLWTFSRHSTRSLLTIFFFFKQRFVPVHLQNYSFGIGGLMEVIIPPNSMLSVRYFRGINNHHHIDSGLVSSFLRNDFHLCVTQQRDIQMYPLFSKV